IFVSMYQFSYGTGAAARKAVAALDTLLTGGQGGAFGFRGRGLIGPVEGPAETAPRVGTWQDSLPHLGLLVVDYLPFFLVAAALVYRGWTTRVLGALALLVRGAMPLVLLLHGGGDLPTGDWKPFLWPAFHLTLAAVLLSTVPTAQKGGR